MYHWRVRYGIMHDMSAYHLSCSNDTLHTPPFLRQRWIVEQVRRHFISTSADACPRRRCCVTTIDATVRKCRFLYEEFLATFYLATNIFLIEKNICWCVVGTWVSFSAKSVQADEDTFDLSTSTVRMIAILYQPICRHGKRKHRARHPALPSTFFLSSGMTLNRLTRHILALPEECKRHRKIRYQSAWKCD